MKRLLLLCASILIALQAAAATLRVQNFNDEPLQVWLINPKEEIIGSWEVEEGTSKLLNSHLHGIYNIAWTRASNVSHIGEKELSRSSVGRTYTYTVEMKPLAVGHHIKIYKHGKFDYKPGALKKIASIKGQAKGTDKDEVTKRQSIIPLRRRKSTYKFSDSPRRRKSTLKVKKEKCETCYGDEYEKY